MSAQPIMCEHKIRMDLRCDECWRKRGWFTAGCIDVEAAVERAARWGYMHRPNGLDPDGYRAYVRPIVLAALGLS